MDLTSIKQTNASQKGTAIGKVAGFGIGSAYILKNRKDIFETAIKEGSEKLAGKASHNKAVALGCGACALFIGASTIAGKFIGKGIGKLVDKHNQKENDKKVLKELMSKIHDNSNVNQVSIEELNKWNDKTNKS